MYSRLSPAVKDVFVSAGSPAEEISQSNAPQKRQESLAKSRGSSILSGSGIRDLLDRFGLGKLDIGDLILILILFLLVIEDGDNDFLLIMAVFLLFGL